MLFPALDCVCIMYMYIHVRIQNYTIKYIGSRERFFFIDV